MKPSNQSKVEFSLTNPDLTGLWSCSLIKGNGVVDKFKGGLVLLALTLSWSLGTFLPLFLPWFIYKGGNIMIVGVLLAVILAWPFIFKVKPWPQASRFWLTAAYYFDGGCSMSYEKRNPDDLSTPQMQAYHPHGIFTLGLILNSGLRSTAAEHKVGSKAWAKYVGSCGHVPFVGLAAEKLVQMPLFKHIMVGWTGNIESASKSHMIKKMKKGDSFGLCPGGFHELSLFVKDKERVYTKKTGFIYYALKYGYTVTPVYTFGESSTFFNMRGFERIKEKMSDFGVPTILITGPFYWIPFLALLPFGNRGLHTIHGVGRKFPLIENPTKEQVEEYHKWYCSALNDLYERHKQRFGITEKLEFYE